MSNRKPLPGKFVWFELISKDAKRAQAFYGDVLGWKVQAFPMGDQNYEMIFAGDTMIGGYAAPTSGRPSRWISYVSVEDVDEAAHTAAANGGKVIVAPYDLPEVGRTARIADPLGAEICPFKNSAGDPADEMASQGRFFWDELHTPDPTKALAFYENVIGFTHRSMDVGTGGTYHVLESQDGVGRGGVTSHLAPGAPPHWLPYVFVDDPDATIATARKLGATIHVGPTDIPGVGRFGVIEDPIGAKLAVMKPRPIENPE